MKLEINILTTSKEIENLCRKYWDLADGRKFSYTVTEISKDFNVQKTKILKIVNANCIAYSYDDVCVNCGTSMVLKSRNDFLQRKSYY